MMKKLACLSLLLFAACSSTSLACVNTPCSSGSNSYQTCDQANGSVEYKFGKMSCNCSATSQGGCTDCETQITTYCGS
jgi:hypothetical protein